MLPLAHTAPASSSRPLGNGAVVAAVVILPQFSLAFRVADRVIMEEGEELSNIGNGMTKQLRVGGCLEVAEMEQRDWVGV